MQVQPTEKIKVMASISKSRIFQSDLESFLQTVNQKRVRLFIREASGTHYSSLYVILSVQEESTESSWIYEVFSNFSSDSNGRRRSINAAHEDLLKVKSKLQKNGFDVQHGDGLDSNTWSFCEVHKTTHYF